MSIFTWLVQAAYDTGQAAIAARKYDGQAAAKLRQVSEICLWNADKVRPFLSWAEPGVIDFPDCPINSRTLSTDEAEIGEKGLLAGSLVSGLSGLIHSRPGTLYRIAPGTTGVSDLVTLMDDVRNTLEMTFEALIASAMNSIGRKLAIQNGENFQPFTIVNNYDKAKPCLFFCTVCGSNSTERLEEDKCATCQSGWNSMELWPKE